MMKEERVPPCAEQSPVLSTISRAGRGGFSAFRGLMRRDVTLRRYGSVMISAQGCLFCYRIEMRSTFYQNSRESRKRELLVEHFSYTGYM